MDISLPALESFIDGLIAEKFSGQTLDDAVLTDIKRELMDRLNQYMTLRTIEMVSQTDSTAIQKLSDMIKANPAPEEVQKFISGFVKEPDVLVATILSDFKALYLGTETKQSN